MKKKIVCLANSRKDHGKCVAGKEIENFEWIRPISSRPLGEISMHEECLNENCTQRNDYCRHNNPPKLLDVIEVGLSGNVAHDHQPENFVIDNSRWIKTGILNMKYIDNLLDNEKGALWSLGSSSRYGENDRVPVAEISGCYDSLRFIAPDYFSIRVKQEYDTVKIRGIFEFEGEDYCIRITDPKVETEYRREGVGIYNFNSDDIRLCISLAETEFDGYFYKLIAGIIFL